MENETKEREYVNGLTVEVRSVEVLQNTKDPEKVNKIIFETEKGKITYKPKMDKSEFIQGLKFTKQDSCTINDLPANLFEIAKEVNEKGSAKVLATYQVWNTTADGSPVTYRYINGEKMFESWKLVTMNGVTEERVQS